MIKLNTFALTFLAVAAIGSVTGCDAGNAPSGMSGDDAKNAIARMSPEDKIRAIASSPMPQAEKEKEYAKIEADSGVKAKDVLNSNTGAPVPGGG
jgi:hypothetical protein